MTRSRSDIDRDLQEYSNLNLKKPMLVSQLTQYSHSLSDLQAELTALPTTDEKDEKSSHEELASQITTLQEKTSSFLNARLDTRSSRQHANKEDTFSRFPALVHELQEKILSFSSYHDLSLMKNISRAFTLLINEMPAPEHLLHPFKVSLNNPNNPIVLQYNHVEEDKRSNDNENQRKTSAGVTDNSQKMRELTERSQNSLIILELTMRVVDQNLKEQLQINRESIINDMSEDAQSRTRRTYTISSSIPYVGSVIGFILFMGSLVWGIQSGNQGKDGELTSAVITSMSGLCLVALSRSFTPCRHNDTPSSFMGSVCGFFSERRARARAESSLQQFSLTRVVTTLESASVEAGKIEVLESNVENGQEDLSINRTLLSSTSLSSSQNR